MASKCIKMHQNVSKCIKMYADGIIIMFWAWNFNLENSIFWTRIANFFLLSAQNESICFRTHQNVCRMNCANVLCTKIPKKWILLHFYRLKLKNYLYLFVMEDPGVCPILGLYLPIETLNWHHPGPPSPIMKGKFFKSNLLL